MSGTDIPQTEIKLREVLKRTSLNFTITLLLTTKLTLPLHSQSACQTATSALMAISNLYKNTPSPTVANLRLMGLLSARKEAEFEIFLGVADKYTPDMEELKDSVRELIRVQFGVKAISQLSVEQKVVLCSLMRRNFRASRKQIALITRLNMETINKVV